MSARDYGRFDPPDDADSLDALMDDDAPVYPNVDSQDDVTVDGWVRADEVERWVAHAVALEREAIAAFIDRDAQELRASGSYEEEFELITDLATAIRQGAHNPQPTTSGAGTGHQATETPSGPTDASDGDSGAQGGDL